MRTFTGCILFLLLIASPALSAQNPASKSDIDELKALIAAQQKVLEEQQAEIQVLQLSLAEKAMPNSVAQHGKQGAALVPAVVHVAVPSSAYHVTAEPQAPSQQGQADQQPTPQEQEKVGEELQRGPEIADVTPDTPAVQLGPAKIRLIGYPALTGIWRETNAGGGTGTSFAGLPFENTIPGNTSEFRLSTQSTRLAIRVDADLQKSRAAGYFEMDFGGTVPGTVAVSSSSYGFRVRHAWFDYAWGEDKKKYEITAGQLFTLLTPEKVDVLPWPGDVATTQVIDTNYVVGLVWAREPQVRFVYRAAKGTVLAASVENPEQQVGGGSLGVVFPAGIASTLNTQYNTGSNELKVPNMTPDFILKASFDGKPSGRKFHLDAGTVLRVFRNFDPTGAIGAKHYAPGAGVNMTGSYEFVKGVRLLFQGFYGYGAGRYVGGLVPDVIVKADGNIDPITSYAWVSGFEIAPNKATGFYAYYSGVYGERKWAYDADGVTKIGWGFPGASNAADRIISEATAGYSKVLWKAENLGSVQWGLQWAYVWLHPWSAKGGPSKADANMVFSQLRYNLP